MYRTSRLHTCMEVDLITVCTFIKCIYNCMSFMCCIVLYIYISSLNLSIVHEMYDCANGCIHWLLLICFMYILLQNKLT